MKVLTFLCLLIFLALPVFTTAQQQNEMDALYLKNGSILRGKIIESTPGKGVRIEIVGKNVLFIEENEIQKMVMREKTEIQAEVTEPIIAKTACKSSGLEFQPNIHLYGGTAQTWGLTATAGYNFNNHVSAGIGTGVEWFNGAMLPVFLKVNYKVLGGSLSPFVYGQAGYSFDIERDPYYYPIYSSSYYEPNSNQWGGILAATGIGVRKDITDHFGVTFSLGYRYQRSLITSEYEIWIRDGIYQTVKNRRVDQFKRIEMSIGFLFK